MKEFHFWQDSGRANSPLEMADCVLNILTIVDYTKTSNFANLKEKMDNCSHLFLCFILLNHQFFWTSCYT